MVSSRLITNWTLLVFVFPAKKVDVPKQKLYVGCGLSNAPESFIGYVENLKTGLETDYNVLRFIGKGAGTDQDVYQWDIHECVANADLFLAVLDYPSTGLGWELGVAVEKLHIPTLAVSHELTENVSRLVKGADAEHFSFQVYGDLLEDVPKMLGSFASKFS